METKLDITNKLLYLLVALVYSAIVAYFHAFVGTDTSEIFQRYEGLIENLKKEIYGN